MNEVSKNLVCIVVRGGIELWIEEERAESLKALLEQKDCPQFIKYEGQLINKADISGVFTAQVMEEKTRRKNGQWQCQYRTWHDRGQKCEGCRSADTRLADENFYNEHGYYPLR